MSIPYTYWPAKEGGYIGYWNDYPEFLTEGESIQDLQYMLRDLRNGIDVMTTETACLSSIWMTDGRVRDYYAKHKRADASFSPLFSTTRLQSSRITLPK